MGRRAKIPQPLETGPKKPLSLEKVADIKEAADRLGVSTKTIRRYITAGKIEAQKIRHIWFVPLDELEKLEQAKEEDEQRLSPIVDELAEAVRHISLRLDQIEEHLSGLSKPGGQPDPKAAEKSRRIDEENRMLREEISELREEMSANRNEGAQVDTQAIKSRAEEIDALKSSIISNERGLALLREEVADKDLALKEKEREIMHLLEKLREYEFSRKPDSGDLKKSGFLGNIIKGVSPGSGRS